MMSIPRTILLLTAVFVLPSCAQLPTGYPIESTAAVTGTDSTTLGKRAAAELADHPGESMLVPLVDGVDAFYARASLIRAAERSVDAQYFLWHDDVTGRVLLKLLLDAADRGVRVRLLLDDLANEALDPEFYALDTHPNFSIRLFNPFPTRGFKYVDFLTDTRRINRRMHNKSFTVDNQFTILGGRNIGDKYFDAMEDVNFYDMDVLGAGPLVAKVSKQFDKYWNHEAVVPIYAFEQNRATEENLEKTRIELAELKERYKESPYADDVRASNFVGFVTDERFPAFFGTAEVLYDDPDKGVVNPPGDVVTKMELVYPYLDRLKYELILISPYFVPRDDGVEFLNGYVEKGKTVDVITNSFSATDSGVVHAGYSRYRDALLGGGVELFEVKPDSRQFRRKGTVAFDSEASLHTKVFIFDREIVYIGSLNLDPRSIDINTEVGVMFHSPEMADIWVSEIMRTRLEHVYELERVRSPTESRGEFTYFTWNIEWVEHVDGETIRHKKEPSLSAWDTFILFLKGFVPEGQI